MFFILTLACIWHGGGIGLEWWSLCLVQFTYCRKMLYILMFLLLFSVGFQQHCCQVALLQWRLNEAERLKMEWEQDLQTTVGHFTNESANSLGANEFGKRLSLCIIFQILTSTHKGKNWTGVWLNTHTKLKRNKNALNFTASNYEFHALCLKPNISYFPFSISITPIPFQPPCSWILQYFQGWKCSSQC